MPPLEKDAHVTPVEGVRMMSSKEYWTVQSLFAVEEVKVMLTIVALPDNQLRFAAGEAPGVVEFTPVENV